MLVAQIRPAEALTLTAQGTEIPDLRAQLIEEAPKGWELVSAHVEMRPGGIRIVEGKFESRESPRDIEADTMDELAAKVPDGWRMLSVRRA
jgi:hypothetical protein